MAEYMARKLADLNPPDKWRHIVVGVFEVSDGIERQIGEYRRDYSLLSSFFAFEKNGKDFALYSPQYTCTRLMELPSCRDIGGEEIDSYGFCPVEYYVPRYVERRYVDGNGKTVRYAIVEPKPVHLEPRRSVQNPEEIDTAHGGIQFTPFGFVSGCVWGDDWSWKVQLLDLSEIERGIVRREARFGYLPLPDGIPLRKCIDLTNFDLDEEWSIVIATQKSFDFRTGTASS